MPTTLLGFAKTIPELGGRVYLDTAPGTVSTPYGIVFDKPGGPVSAYGLSDVVQIYPCITVYDKPASGETSQQARLRLMGIMDKLQSAVYSVDTHTDGVRPFLRGSVVRGNEPTPVPDSSVQGQYKALFQLRAQFYRD